MTRRFAAISLSLVVMFVGLMGGTIAAQEVELYLKTGDHIRGVVVMVNTNEVTLSNSWVKLLPIPLSEITQWQTPAGQVATNQNSVPAIPAITSAQAAQLATLAKPSVAKPAPPKAKLHGQINVGVDTLFATTTQQDYFGNLKITYEHAYASNPKKFFRNTSQVSGEYKKTDDQISANRAKASNKSDFDLGKASYGYVSVGGGFDRVRKIDEQYQMGPGLGRHLVRNDDFALNAESGLDYEAEYRSDASDLDSVYLRLAEDFTWKIRKNLTLTKKMEFLSNLDRTSEYQAGLTSNLSYGFWDNLTLNLTAEENYTTEVAPEVQRNEFEFRLTLGAMF